MSKHIFLPKKQSILSVYDTLGIKPPLIPQEEQFGYRGAINCFPGTGRKFQPTEQDMNRRLIFLLDYLSTKLKEKL